MSPAGAPLKINQRKSMARGGKRPGAGRRPGSLNVRTQEIAARATAEGLTPLEFMLMRMRDEDAPPQDRFEAAKAAAPYVHPRLAAVEHTGKDGGPINVVIAGDDAGLL